MEKLGAGQLVQLELLDVLNTICEKCNINYTLFGSTLIAHKENKGFAKYNYYIEVAMLYDRFEEFIKAFKSEMTDSQYYIMNEDNCVQYNSMSIRVAKRSGVKLAADRADDERYYDNFIIVTPLFYAGNSIKEYNDMKRKYYKAITYYNTRKVLKRKITLFNLHRVALNAYRVSKRNLYSFTKIKEGLCKNKTTRTKYVFTPEMKKAKGISVLADTYKEFVFTEFEGHKCQIIKENETWIKDCYNKETYNNIINKPANRASVVGPEIMRRIQLIELEMLIEFDRICRENNISYTLGFGTMLGAIRHKGFVPWDDDVDICMLYEDYSRFLQIAPSVLDTERFFLRIQETDKDCNLTFAQMKRNNTIFCREARENFDTHQGVFIDILPLYNGSNNIILHKIQNKICMFYKTMIWSHMGAISERRKGYRQYYMLLSKVSNKTAYKKFVKWATIFKKTTNKCIHLTSFVNPFNTAFTRKDTYENIVEMQFEGQDFFVSKDYVEVLKCLYGDEYMRYPLMENRIAKHLPYTIDIGDLYKDM